jgi:hypothetical protein
LNCLDNFDALRVKDVYAPKRKQGEREHQLHNENASYSRRVLPASVVYRDTPCLFLRPEFWQYS